MRCFLLAPVVIALALAAPAFAELEPEPSTIAPAPTPAGTPLLPIPGAAAVPAATPAATRIIPEATPVKVKLLQPLNSHHERTNDRIQFAVSEDVLAPDQTLLIPKGTPVVGTVTEAHHRGMMGKPGKLEFSIDYLQFPADTRVTVRNQRQGASGRSNAGGSISAALLLGPGWLLVNGREVTISAGKEFTVYVDQKTSVPAAPAVATAPTVKPDPWHLQEIKLKNGTTLVGSVLKQEQGLYFIVTDLGQFEINRDAIESLTPKAPPKS